MYTSNSVSWVVFVLTVQYGLTHHKIGASSSALQVFPSFLPYHNFYLHSLCTNQRFLLLALIPHSSLFPLHSHLWKPLPFLLPSIQAFPLPFLLSSSTTIPLTDLRQRYGSSSMAAPSSSLGRRSVINDLAFWGKDGKLMLQYSPIPRPISYCSSVPFPD